MSIKEKYTAAEQPSVLTDELERIAQSWDGCEYDAPGEMIDIGASLRRAFSAVTAHLARQSPAPEKAPVTAIPVELAQVQEQIKEGAGFWHTCSGCHESEDGYDNGHYPYSATLSCKLGMGCRECGGIGAIWDNTDYEAMAADMFAAPVAQEVEPGSAPAAADEVRDA